MISFARARPGLLARLASLAAVLGLLSCSSNVSGPNVADPLRITIQPDTATLYSGMATTFQLAGGTGFYLVSSSNQAVVRVASGSVRSRFTVIPAPVAIDTPVTITVRDTGTAPVVTATLTVRPGTISNQITITPSGTQGGNCEPAVCSGGDAIVTATISQGGVPLAARGVKLEVVSGDFRFITTPPGAQNATLATEVTVVSDQAGQILARLRALPGAANQTAVLQITDLGTGAFQRTVFLIAQATGESPGFFATPGTIVFAGPNDQQCANSGEVQVHIFGGSPPYNISGAGTAFAIDRSSVSVSGGSFSINPLGTCVAADPGLPITIVDAAGRTTTVAVANIPGEFEVPALVVAPLNVTLSNCQALASVTVGGGLPTFTVKSGSSAIRVDPQAAARTFTVTRAPNTVASTPVEVGVTSGSESATVIVNLTDQALNTTCDPSATMRVVPETVTLASCGPVEATIIGGTVGFFTFLSDNSSVAATLVGPDTFRVQRTNSGGFTPPATITVRDTNTGVTRLVTVLATGTGLNSGTGACP